MTSDLVVSVLKRFVKRYLTTASQQHESEDELEQYEVSLYYIIISMMMIIVVVGAS